MRLIASLAVAVSLLAAQNTPRSGLRTVTAVRHWSLNDVTRIVVEVSDDFEFHSDRVHDPERVYFDIFRSRPRFGTHRTYTEKVEDPRVTGIRVAETLPGVTRIVIDLAATTDVNATRLTNPDRLIIELRPRAASTALAEPPPTKPASALPPPILRPEAPKPEPPKPEPSSAAPPLVKAATPATVTPKPEPAIPANASNPAPASLGETPKAARRTSSGDTSLVRALGLKVTRVVIDPGHGGHDQGTQGPKGLLEKDLVLDVAQRVGKLVQERMGAEVIYTRTDDTFIPLEGRTALANEKKADLFLSIHANSSPVPRIAGVETFYLNFTNSKDALDVASRENASSQKSIFELRDIIQKITLHDKAEESREFAARVQSALYTFSARNIANSRNRGVKKAPFVVLIGAHMPSILAEIGFLSNPREEALLKKPDYRQKLAEALFRGLQRYADTLSHFQVAQAKD